MRRPRKPSPRHSSAPPHGGNYKDGGNSKDRADAEFTRDIETRLRNFMESDEQELVLEPMNSYKRRLAHQLAKPYHLKTDSRGQEPERHVCFIKSEESVMPQAAPKARQYDSELSAAPRGAPKARQWDFGTITYPVQPGDDGLHLALKADGSLEIYREGQGQHVVDDKVVTSRQVRIRKGKIVEPGDPDW